MSEKLSPPPTIPDTMHAWVQHRYGDASQLELVDVPTPSPKADEVLIQVASTSINAADRYASNPALVMRPMIGGLRGPSSPVGGLDAAGTVVAVGDDVTDFNIGDRVFGEIGGGFGRYSAGRSERLALVPDAMTLTDAGGVPVAALTALQGLRDIAGVQAGDRVLVNGASGGVGTFAVQIAASLGAHVTAVCSTTKLETARELGASEAIDYTAVDVIDHFTSRDRRFDCLFDVAGVHSVRQRSLLLAETGTCVFVGGPRGGSLFGPLVGFVRSNIACRFVPGNFKMFIAESNGADMDTIAQMIEQGEVRTVVDDVIPFDQMPDAMTRFASGHLAGKVLIAD